MLALLTSVLAFPVVQDLRLAEDPVPRVPYQVDIWTIQDGLPQGEVTDIAQDEDGTLWVATFGGLVSYDGVDLHPLPVESRTELGNNRVTVLCPRRAGGLWIGMESQGVLSLHQGRVRQVVSQEQVQWPVTALTEDAAGRVWLGTGSGLGVWEDGDYRRVSGISGRVNDLLPVPGDGVWCAAASGLWRLGQGPAQQLAVGRYRALARNSSGLIWASHGNKGLVEEWDPTALEPVPLLELGSPINALRAKSNGELWGAGRRLYIPSEEGLVQPLYGTEFEFMGARTLWEDHEGNLWAGGPEGLFRMRPSPLVGFSTKGSGMQVPPRILAPLDDTGSALLVATYRRRLYLFDGETYESVPEVKAAAMLPTSGSEVLVAGTDLWSYAWNGSEGVLEKLAGLQDPTGERGRLAEALMEDRQGRLWVGMSCGSVLRYADLRATTPPVEVIAPGGELDEVLFLTEDRQGDVWLGAHRGLARIRGDQVVESWVTGQNFDGADVRAIYEGPDGTVWAGTYGCGLFHLGANREFHSIGVDDGLMEDVVSRILPDDSGSLVLLGNRAVSRVDYNEPLALARGDISRVHPHTYSEGPGIGSFEGNGGAMPAGWKLSDGSMWFACREGVVRFDPELDCPKLPPPRVRLLSAAMDGQALDSLEEVRLEPGERNLEFCFTTSTFVEPTRARFRYRLLGYDEDWKDGGVLRKATYTRVPPGRYTFQVLACNWDGVWSTEPASMRLHLLPRSIETLWFRWLLGFAGLALVGGAFLWRSRSARSRARLLESEVQSRTAELEEARARLEERVEERSRQLQEDMDKRARLEEQLQATQRLESIGRLAGGLAHDFNNYLMVVMAESDMALDALLAKRSDPQALVDCMHGIRDVSARAAKLTGQLLAYSRQQVLEPEHVRLGVVVGGMREVLQRLVQGEIRLEFQLSLPDDVILVDPGQLEQVLVNLVMNAKDAIKNEGLIVVTIERRALDPQSASRLDRIPGEYVVLTVTDTGLGMDDHVRERLFEPFFTTKPKGKGTGLGLASLHGIVEQSGGFTEVQSTLGEGSTFAVWFPACEPLSLGPKAPSSDRRRIGRGCRIMVCDDQEAVGRVTASMLSSLGYEAEVFFDPKAALEAGRDPSREFDALVTDLVMPEMGGRELVSELRVQHPEMPVLFISGYTYDELDISADLDEASRFLAKPFDRKSLEHSMRTLMPDAATRVGSLPHDPVL